jgi:hypothetical protein
MTTLLIFFVSEFTGFLARTLRFENFRPLQALTPVPSPIGRGVSASLHSYLSATSGSTFVARRAGA